MVTMILVSRNCQLSLLLTCILFYEHPKHRHLHSFPTRRSSDLSVGTAVATVVSTGPQTGRVTAMHPGRTTMAATYGGTAALATIVVPGWYASPSGSSAGDGSRQPWDLQTALSGGQGRVQPGDTIWLR